MLALPGTNECAFNHSSKWSSAGTPQPSTKRSVRSGPSSHEAQMMLLKAISYPHLPQAGSPYCSDPNCAYCLDLRKVQEHLRNGQPISPSRKGICSVAIGDFFAP